MQTTRLSREIESLIARIPQDPSAPFYLEDTLRRKLDRSAVRALRQAEDPCSLRPVQALIDSEWADIVAAANLTERQRQVLALRMEGVTYVEMGERFGITKQSAQNTYTQAAKRIARAWMDYRYHGLAEVYHQETHRGVRRRR